MHVGVNKKEEKCNVVVVKDKTTLCVRALTLLLFLQLKGMPFKNVCPIAGASIVTPGLKALTAFLLIT